MTDEHVGEFTNLHAVWPRKLKGRRNYKAKLLQAFSLLERHELRRLIRKRLVAMRKGKAGAHADKRWAKDLIRRIERQPGSNRRLPVPKDILLGRKKDGEILDALYPERQAEWVLPVKRRKHHALRIKNFSLIDHPIHTFRTLRELAMLEAVSASIRVNFEDDACLDVSGYLLLGLMAQNMIRVMDGGAITGAVRGMLNAVDLASFMGVHAPDDASDPTFSPFRLRNRRPSGTSTTKTSAFEPSKTEKLADDLTDTMDSWMAVSGRPALTRDMRACVARLVTEVLDNAVRHSDLNKKDGDWAVAGFLSAASSPGATGKPSMMCSLTMVSGGATIFESMQRCDDEATAAALKEYVEAHVIHPSHGAPGRSAELLTTVFAMQDGVSRFRQGDDDSRGGVGMMDTVQFMNEIAVGLKHYEQPAMVLISGRACVMIQKDYRCAPDPYPGQPRTLWFNARNTLEEPPDSAYVGSLPHPYPGTIVALRFCIGEGTSDMPEDRIAS